MKRFLSAGMGLILALSLVGCASAPSEAASASASAATAVASMPVSTVSNEGLEAYDLESVSYTHLTLPTILRV